MRRALFVLFLGLVLGLPSMAQVERITRHQIDGVNLTSRTPVNFLDTSEFDWTNPAAGDVSLALKAAFINALGDFASTLCGTGEILEDQGASWACIATPSGAAHAILSATHTDTTPAAVTRGGLMVGQTATPVWQLLAVGGVNDIFGSDGTDAAWETATGTASPVRANNPLFPDKVRFTAIAAPAHSAGQFFYDSGDESLGFHNSESGITLQIGQEGWVRVRNESGATITNGQVVYIDGIASGLPSIALAKADALSTALAVGFATHDIENVSNGFVTLYGVVRDINTTGLTDDVYLSATTAGGMADSPPSDPNFVVPLGTIVETGATGDVFVNSIAPRPTGGAGVAVSGNSVAVDLLTADDQVGSSSNQSGMEFGDTGSDKLGLLRGCTLNQILKFNTTGGLWECSADVSGGSPTLDTIAAAAGAASINNADNAIVWNWSLATASKVGFKFGENVASTATTDPIILNAVTLAASTAHPFQATSRGTANGIRVGATDGIVVALGTGGLDWPALLNYPTGCTNQFVRTIADTLTCNTVDLANDVTGILDEANLDANVVLDNASNTYSAGAQDFTSATSLTTPVAAGAGPTASGQVAYDSTAQQLEYGDNAVNRIVVNTDEAQTLSTKTLDSSNVVQAGAYDAASIDGDDINSSLAGTGLTLTPAAPDTLDCNAPSVTVVGCPELATIAETDTGTDTERVITPDGLAGSIHGQVEVQMVLFDFTTAVATGDGKFYFHIATGSKLIGMNLIDAIAAVITVSSSGLPTVDIARCAPVATGNPCSGTVADVLSTNLTIDVNEDSSDTATTAAVIAGASDDVIVDQTWRIDVDVAGTGTQGLIVTLIFQLP